MKHKLKIYNNQECEELNVFLKNEFDDIYKEVMSNAIDVATRHRPEDDNSFFNQHKKLIDLKVDDLLLKLENKVGNESIKFEYHQNKENFERTLVPIQRELKQAKERLEQLQARYLKAKNNLTITWRSYVVPAGGIALVIATEMMLSSGGLEALNLAWHEATLMSLTLAGGFSAYPSLAQFLVKKLQPFTGPKIAWILVLIPPVVMLLALSYWRAQARELMDGGLAILPIFFFFFFYLFVFGLAAWLANKFFPTKEQRQARAMVKSLEKDVKQQRKELEQIEHTIETLRTEFNLDTSAKAARLNWFNKAKNQINVNREKFKIMFENKVRTVIHDANPIRPDNGNYIF